MMSFLQKRYGDRPDVILRQNAAGVTLCQTEMFVSTRNPTVTSLSRSWIKKVSQDPSFAKVIWDQKLTVDVTTLDQLIEEYGLPTLCKIDVEGYEPQVLRGLSYPIPVLSFEYIPADISPARKSLSEIQRIGHYHFNWSVGESYHLQSPIWLKFQDMQDLLFSKLKNGRSGDIYATLDPSNKSV
jgi:FkbM family methyltransferase